MKQKIAAVLAAAGLLTGAGVAAAGTSVATITVASAATPQTHFYVLYV